MTIKEPIVAIVDGYSSGSQLAKEFRLHGYEVIHIQSDPVIPKVYVAAFKPETYLTNLIYTGDTPAILEALAEYAPQFVISGSEPGVLAADKISEALNLPSSNGTKLSEARRNKYLMMEQIRSAGLNAIREFKSADIEALKQWALSFSQWPIVAKPLASAMGDGFMICYNEADIEEASQLILNNKPNVMGVINREVLLQEFIKGDEYVVNTVSHNGQHYVSGIWKYKRIRLAHGQQVYDTATLISYQGNRYDAIVDYTFAVLDALSIDNGAAHTELMITDSGPMLMESGARPMGGNFPAERLKECLEHSQIELTVLSYVNPEAFSKFLGKKYQLRKHMVAVMLISHHEGLCRGLQVEEKIKALPSFAHAYWTVHPGERLVHTYDLKTSPGIIFLVHESTAVIEADSREIRKLERKGLFILKTVPNTTSCCIV